MKKYIVTLVVLVSSITAFSQTSPIWVSPYGSGAMDGTSPNDAIAWSTIVTHVLDEAQNSVHNFELWLLDGVYVEGERFHYTNLNQGQNQHIFSFRIFGGFNGTETNVFERDLSQYRSTIEIDDHVGLHIEGADLIIVDGLSFTSVNEADSAAMNLVAADTYVSKCRFENINIVDPYEQLIKFENGSIRTTKLINCLMVENVCSAIIGATGDVDVINCTISDNTCNYITEFWNGSIPYNNSPYYTLDTYLYNSIVYDNTFLEQGATPIGSTNLDKTCLDHLLTWMVDNSCMYAYPDFVGTGMEPYSLLATSSLINYGAPNYIDNEPYILKEQDIISHHRFADFYHVHTALDLGAYQFFTDDKCDDWDFTDTGFDFDFVFYEEQRGIPGNKGIKKTERAMYMPQGVYSLSGIKLSDITDNLPSGLYIINGKMQWIP